MTQLTEQAINAKSFHKKAQTNPHQQVVNSLLQMQQNSFHKKKTDLLISQNAANNNNLTKNVQQITSQILSICDLKTNLQPVELDYILNSLKSLNNDIIVNALNDYKYEVIFNMQKKDYIYNEETDDLDPVDITITIHFSILILQIKEYNGLYTLKFQNYTPDHSFEFGSTCKEIVDYIKTF